MENQYALESPEYFSERRRSSDIYLEPSTSEGSKRQTLLETDFDLEVKTKITHFEEVDEPDKLTSKVNFCLNLVIVIIFATLTH